MIIVSACFCGINCKYNGENNYNETIAELFRKGKAIPVCPEQLGGQRTPRAPHEIVSGTGADVLEGRARVLGPAGFEHEYDFDSTDAFIKGAEETLCIAKACGAQVAVLKARSPSCGHGCIYDGTFSGTRREGNGVTAELLVRNGIRVLSEDDELSTI